MIVLFQELAVGKDFLLYPAPPFYDVKGAIQYIMTIYVMDI